MHPATVRPAHDEAADYYFTYIDAVPQSDVRDLLHSQGEETVAFLRSIPEARVQHAYAEGKWTIAEVIAHLNDCERLFAFRALWFARALDTPLPSFDQHVAALHAAAGDRPWRSHLDEFAALRASTVSFFRHLPDEAWTRRGVASDNHFTVRALAYITAGHVTHHTRILKERYL